jgi:ketol-acid reductoisomerase
MGPFWNYCLLVLLGGFVTTIATQTTIVAVIMVAAEGRGCPIPNVLCTTGVDAARAILKNASTEAPAVATKSVAKTGITTVGILTPAFAASSLQQKL